MASFVIVMMELKFSDCNVQQETSQGDLFMMQEHIRLQHGQE